MASLGGSIDFPPAPPRAHAAAPLCNGNGGERSPSIRSWPLSSPLPAEPCPPSHMLGLPSYTHSCTLGLPPNMPLGLPPRERAGASDRPPSALALRLTARADLLELAALLFELPARRLERRLVFGDEREITISREISSTSSACVKAPGQRSRTYQDETLMCNRKPPSVDHTSKIWNGKAFEKTPLDPTRSHSTPLDPTRSHSIPLDPHSTPLDPTRSHWKLAL